MVLKMTEECVQFSELCEDASVSQRVVDDYSLAMDCKPIKSDPATEISLNLLDSAIFCPGRLSGVEEAAEEEDQQDETQKPAEYQKDLHETIQLCEALMAEKVKISAERDLIEHEFFALREENQALVQEKEHLLRDLEEMREVAEFKILEQETAKQCETELASEIASLKMAAEESSTFIQRLEADLNATTTELKQKNEQISELQSLVGKDSSEKIQQLKRSLEDAELVGRDVRKEWAMLRTEVTGLREKEVAMNASFQRMEVELKTLRGQLGEERSRSRRVQADLQRELQGVYQENGKLTLLLQGKPTTGRRGSAEQERAISDLQKDLQLSQQQEKVLQMQLEDLRSASAAVKRDHSRSPCELEQLVPNVELKSEGKESSLEEPCVVKYTELLNQVTNLSEALEKMRREKDVLLSEGPQGELQELRSSMAALTDERDQLLQRMSELQDETEQKGSYVEKLKQQQQCLNAGQQSMNENVHTELQQEVQCLHEELKNVTNERNSLKARLEACSQKPDLYKGRSSTPEQRGSLVDTCDPLLRSRLGEYMRQIQALQLQVKELEGQRSEAEKSVCIHKEATQLLQTELQDVWAQLRERDTTLQALTQKLRESQELEDKKAELEEMWLHVAGLEAQIDTMSTKHGKEVKGLMGMLEQKDEVIKNLKSVIKPSASPLIQDDTATRGSSVTSQNEVTTMETPRFTSLGSAQRVQSAKWRRRAIQLKENRKDDSPMRTLSPRTPTGRRQLVATDSPKSKFFDVKSDKVSISHPQKFFDNSGLGALPDFNISVESPSDHCPLSPRQEDNCKTQ